MYAISKEMYAEIAQKLNKWNRNIDLIAAKLSPVFIVIPKGLACLAIYWTTDLHGDAFELIFPMW